jgi:hypothetical protein
MTARLKSRTAFQRKPDLLFLLIAQPGTSQQLLKHQNGATMACDNTRRGFPEEVWDGLGDGYPLNEPSVRQRLGGIGVR